MIQTQIFQTPTGNVYNPSEKIDRNFQRIGNQVNKMMTDESNRLKMEQDLFNQAYANIGEIEANLQQNYAGIMQKAVDSTKEFLKDQIKSGKSVNDPSFQMGYQDKVSRIRAMVGNADRNRQQIKEAAELLKSDPTILDKGTAFTTLMAKMQDPDFLVSQNQFDAEGFLGQFVNPYAVFDEARKRIPTQGEYENVFEENGNTLKRQYTFNEIIPQDAPVTPDGRPNVQVTPKFMEEVYKGTYGPRLPQVIDKIAKERYADQPIDKARIMASKDGFAMVFGNNNRVSVIETADQKRRREANENRQNAATDLAIKREQRMSGQLDEQEEFNDRYQRFISSAQSGDKTFLGSYDNISPNVKDFQYGVTLDGNAVSEKELEKLKTDLSSYDNWKKLGRDKRKALIGVIAGEEPSWYNDTDTEDMYQKVVESFASKEIKPIVTYQQKDGSSEGSTNWTPRVLPLGSQEELDYAFQTLENLRLSGAKPKTEARVPEKTTGGASRFNTPK